MVCNLILPETLEIVIDRNVTMIGQLSLEIFYSQPDIIGSLE